MKHSSAQHMEAARQIAALSEREPDTTKKAALLDQAKTFEALAKLAAYREGQSEPQPETKPSSPASSPSPTGSAQD